MAKVSKSIPAPPLTDAMYERGRKTAKPSPFDVVRARYNRANDTLDLTLRKGILIALPRTQVKEIAKVSADSLRRIQIQPGGDGISIRSIDVDIYVPGLLAEELATIFAKANGSKTRGRSSARKAAAARENGRKGGRPRKAA
jgi:hypothetical protein